MREIESGLVRGIYKRALIVSDHGASRLAVLYGDKTGKTIDPEEYRDCREGFTLDEWIDVILGAIDYNASGYEKKSQKLAMITRLLPFVEKRLNMIELAPKGMGKSYLFGSVSRYGWLSSGGMMTRAKMFYGIFPKPTWKGVGEITIRM